MKNQLSDCRTPKGQKNYQTWEFEIFKQAHKTLTAKQVVQILKCLGSKRTVDSVARKSKWAGWTLKKELR